MYLLTPAHHSDAVCGECVSRQQTKADKLSWIRYNIFWTGYWSDVRAVKASVVIIMKFIFPGCHRPSLLTPPGANPASVRGHLSHVIPLFPFCVQVTATLMPINWFFVLPKFSSFARTRTPRVHKCVKTEIDCIILIPDMSPRTK